MRPDRLAIALTAISLVSLSGAGCGGAKPQQAMPTPAATPTVTATPAATPRAADQPAVLPRPLANPVEPELLMELLPEGAGWTRATPRFEQVTMGISMSRAQAEYTRGESAIDLEITDSALNQVFLAPLTTYLVSGYSERSPEGYRRAAPVGGQPAFETWNNESKRAVVTVVVANRFVVQATGNNVENTEAVRTLVEAVDFSKLATLR